MLRKETFIKKQVDLVKLQFLITRELELIKRHLYCISIMSLHIIHCPILYATFWRLHFISDFR